MFTWFVYSPHWEPPPRRAVKVFTSSALASGSNKMRIQRAEHMLQLGGLVKVRKAIAVTRLVRPCLVSAGGHGTWECVLHHVRLCWLSLQGTQLRKQFHEAIRTPASTRSQVYSMTSTAKGFTLFCSSSSSFLFQKTLVLFVVSCSQSPTNTSLVMSRNLFSHRSFFL